MDFIGCSSFTQRTRGSPRLPGRLSAQHVFHRPRAPHAVQMWLQPVSQGVDALRAAGLVSGAAPSSEQKLLGPQWQKSGGASSEPRGAGGGDLWCPPGAAPPQLPPARQGNNPPFLHLPRVHCLVQLLNGLKAQVGLCPFRGVCVAQCRPLWSNGVRTDHRPARRPGPRAAGAGQLGAGLAVVPVEEEQGEGAHHQEEEHPHAEARVVLDGLSDVLVAFLDVLSGAHNQLVDAVNVCFLL